MSDVTAGTVWTVEHLEPADPRVLDLVDQHLPTLDGRSPRTMRKPELWDLLQGRSVLRCGSAVAVAGTEPIGSRAAQHHRVHLDVSETCTPEQWAAAFNLVANSLRFTCPVRKVSVLVDDASPAAAGGCAILGLVNEGFMRAARFVNGQRRDIVQYSTPEETP